MSNILEKFDLHGKTAVVTGGSGLLGRQFSLALAQAGANILVADLAQQAAEAHALNLREQGLRAEGFGVDVTDPASTQAMARAAQEIFGGLDILVNSAALDPKFDPANAGSQGANAFESYSLDSWRQALDVNLTGMFLASQAAVQPMLEAGKGVIINNASVLGWRAQTEQAHYAAAKAGVMALTRCAAVEAAEFGIRINAVAPSIAIHAFLKKSASEELLNELSAKEAFGRGAEPWEVANVMIFLASDYSSYMTGEVVSVSSQRA